MTTFKAVMTTIVLIPVIIIGAIFGGLAIGALLDVIVRWIM